MSNETVVKPKKIISNEEFLKLRDEYEPLLKLIQRRYITIDRDDKESIRWGSIWKAAQNYDESMGKFSNYVGQIFRNELAKQLEKQQAQKRRFGVKVYLNDKRFYRDKDKLPLELLNENHKVVVEKFLEGKNTQEIGDELGITHQRASQIINTASAFLNVAINCRRVVGAAITLNNFLLCLREFKRSGLTHLDFCAKYKLDVFEFRRLFYSHWWKTCCQ